MRIIGNEPDVALVVGGNTVAVSGSAAVTPVDIVIANAGLGKGDDRCAKFSFHNPILLLL